MKGAVPMADEQTEDDLIRALTVLVDAHRDFDWRCTGSILKKRWFEDETNKVTRASKKFITTLDKHIDARISAALDSQIKLPRK